MFWKVILSNVVKQNWFVGYDLFSIQCQGVKHTKHSYQNADYYTIEWFSAIKAPSCYKVQYISLIISCSFSCDSSYPSLNPIKKSWLVIRPEWKLHWRFENKAEFSKERSVMIKRLCVKRWKA